MRRSGAACASSSRTSAAAKPAAWIARRTAKPGKYTFCCAENEQANPWEPLHVERGFARGESTVTVAAPLGTWNMNTHAKDVGDLLRVIGDTMAFPCSSDYVHGGSPFLVLSPEHARILKRDGLSQAEVRRRLWDESRLSATRLSAKDFGRHALGLHADLGALVFRDPVDYDVLNGLHLVAHGVRIDDLGRRAGAECGGLLMKRSTSL